MQIKAWLWEKDAVSDFGKSPQQAIFEQLGTYDIYIGLMGSRFGAPTKAYGSGTEEEFEEALTAHRDGKVLRVGFFFKNVQINFSELGASDIQQLGKVQEFRSRIGPLGLFNSFSEKHELSLLVQRLVSAAIDSDFEEKVVSGHQFNLHTAPGTEKVPTVSKSFFAETLNNLDEDLTNGDRTRLTLEDIWVDPELRYISGKSSPDNAIFEEYTFDDLINDLDAKNSIVLYGTEKTGRTSACRKAFMKLREKGYFPVILDSARINNPDIERNLQRIYLAYTEQYDNLPSDKAKEFTDGKAVLIIDDYDRARLNLRHSSLLLSQFHSKFHAVLISVNALYALNPVATPEEASAFGSLKRIEIREVGHKKRYELIEKWCVSGQRAKPDEENFRSQVDTKRRIIDRVLGASFVPRTPVIILILLQAIDVGQAGDLTRTGYVRYYKFLIDGAILRNATPEDAELAYALLPEVAWAMHKSQTDVLQPQDTERVVEQLATKRALHKVSLYNVLGKLRQVGMFDEHENGHKFKHKYTYYFFLTDYINRNLDQAYMQEEVKKLCQSISNRMNAETLVFLSFHTENRIIVDNLMEGLASCYVDGNKFDFSSDRTASVNQLVYDLPKQVVDHTEFSKGRSTRLQSEQQLEEIEEENKSKDNGDSEWSKLQVTLTAIDILGHILRNHYARIDAEPKKEIFEAASNAALRCIGYIFDHLSSSLESLVVTISSLTDRLDLDNNNEKRVQDSDKDRREALAKRLIFYMLVAFVYYVTYRLVRSVGDEKLDITYSQALEGSPNNMRKFINLAIKLDSFKEFPIDELKDLAKSVETDRFALASIRMFVRQRLDYRPPAKIGDLQRICDAAGMSLRRHYGARQRS